MDSNHRRRKPADLQSAPFGHSGICPIREQIPKDYSLNYISSWAYLETAAKLGNNSNPQNKSAIYFTPFPEKDLPHSSPP